MLVKVKNPKCIVDAIHMPSQLASMPSQPDFGWKIEVWICCTDFLLFNLLMNTNILDFRNVIPKGELSGAGYP